MRSARVDRIQATIKPYLERYGLDVNGFDKARIVGEHPLGVEASDSTAGGSERRVFFFPEIGLSVVDAMIVAV